MSWDRFKSVFFAGLLLLIPVVFVLIGLGYVYDIALVIALAGEDILGLQGIGDALAFNLFVILVVLAIIYAFGLLAERGILTGRLDALDRVLGKLLPGYAITKTRVMGAVNSGKHIGEAKPVLVKEGQYWRIGLETEQSKEGTTVVFIPLVPNLETGYVIAVPIEDIRHVEMSPKEFFEAFEYYGRGLSSMVDDVRNRDKQVL